MLSSERKTGGKTEREGERERDFGMAKQGRRSRVRSWKKSEVKRRCGIVAEQRERRTTKTKRKNERAKKRGERYYIKE